MLERDPDYEENTMPIEVKAKRGAVTNPFLRAVMRRLARERAERLEKPDVFKRVYEKREGER